MQDKQALKTAVKILVNNPLVKGEAAKVFVEGLENHEIEVTDWFSFFESEGVTSERSKSIYNVNMLRGLFLRAIAIPQALQQFFFWLTKPPKNQKSLNYRELARKFQNELASHLSHDELQLIHNRLNKGIYCILRQLLEKQITPKQCLELLQIADYIFEDFLNKLIKELENIILRISKRHNSRILSQITPEKEVWQPLDDYYQKNLRQQPYYQPFAELFRLLQKYTIVTYFSQISGGNVSKSLYQKAQLETSNLWEVEIQPQLNLAKSVMLTTLAKDKDLLLFDVISLGTLVFALALISFSAGKEWGRNIGLEKGIILGQKEMCSQLEERQKQITEFKEVIQLDSCQGFKEKI